MGYELPIANIKVEKNMMTKPANIGIEYPILKRHPMIINYIFLNAKIKLTCLLQNLQMD